MRENNFVDGKCSKCGKCCSAVLPLSQFEINKLKKFVTKNNIVPYTRSTIGADFINVCPFLNLDNECSIYSRRPAICDWFSCDGNEGYFEHGDKKIVNLYTEFFPEIKFNNLPDVEQMNRVYQFKKGNAGFNTKVK